MVLLWLSQMPTLPPHQGLSRNFELTEFQFFLNQEVPPLLVPKLLCAYLAHLRSTYLHAQPALSSYRTRAVNRRSLVAALKIIDFDLFLCDNLKSRMIIFE